MYQHVAFLAKENAMMKRLFTRSTSVRQQPSAARVCTPAPMAHTPLEQVRALDSQTSWPTHRIRNFLTTQSRTSR